MRTHVHTWVVHAPPHTVRVTETEVSTNLGNWTWWPWIWRLWPTPGLLASSAVRRLDTPGCTIDHPDQGAPTACCETSSVSTPQADSSDGSAEKKCVGSRNRLAPLKIKQSECGMQRWLKEHWSEELSLEGTFTCLPWSCTQLMGRTFCVPPSPA